MTLGTGEPAATIPLHPVIVLTALAIQWKRAAAPRARRRGDVEGPQLPVGGAE